jgi:hypothetical protein
LTQGGSQLSIGEKKRKKKRKAPEFARSWPNFSVVKNGFLGEKLLS